MRFPLPTLLLALGAGAASAPVAAAEYALDPTHSFVEFRVQHLGYSWLYGRFNAVEGTLEYDAAKPAASRVAVTIDTASIDSNHAERDKHLRSADFLGVEAFPKATFTSTGYQGDAERGVLSGVLSFHGVEKAIEIPVEKVGEGEDPWGGYRAGFHGTYTMTRADFGLDYNLGPAATQVVLELGIEGVRK
ncbi:MAG: YceI family protein [Gammaproteobacteria bacterium]|nr:YceI family protein [Gammaproteobacteria bacterium]MCP5201057.1 YceI family protein [Gammaproteobacteria bacterium]